MVVVSDVYRTRCCCYETPSDISDAIIVIILLETTSQKHYGTTNAMKKSDMRLIPLSNRIIMIHLLGGCQTFLIENG